MSSKIVTIIAAVIGGAIGSFVFNALPSGADVEDTTYTAVAPCAVFDSRASQGASGASLGPFNGDKVNGVFTGANAKTFQVTGAFPASQGGGNADCGIPASAVAVHINIVAVNPITAGNVVVAAADGAPPSGGIVNYQVLAPSLNNSNAFNVPLSATGAIDVYANCGDNCTTPTVDVRGVVIGYYSNSLEQRVTQLEQRTDILEQLVTELGQAPAAACPGCVLAADEMAGANLPGADLSGADLRATNLTGANLTSTNLSDTVLFRTTLTDADLTGANLTNSSLSEANLSNVILEEADLTGADLYRADLTGNNLTGANLTGANLGEATLTGANLTSGNLTSVFLLIANLQSANLQDANLLNAILYGANLTGADLTGADLTGADLRLVVWSVTTCPDGTVSSTNGTSPESCIGHL